MINDGVPLPPRGCEHIGGSTEGQRLLIDFEFVMGGALIGNGFRPLDKVSDKVFWGKS
jgi:hypothetical protein